MDNPEGKVTYLQTCRRLGYLPALVHLRVRCVFILWFYIHALLRRIAVRFFTADGVFRKKNHSAGVVALMAFYGSPKGIRTLVSAVRGRHPRPLDDRTVKRIKKWQPKKDSNPCELIQSQSCYRYTIRLQYHRGAPQ